MSRAELHPSNLPAADRFGVRTISLVLIILVSLSACAKVTLPPVTSPPTGSHLTGKFIWFDLLTEDVEEAKLFYGNLFGWTFEELEETDDYTLIRNGQDLVGGIFYTDQLEDESEARWVSYLSVPDVDEATKLTVDHGGEVHFKPVDYPHRGRFSIVGDPQGAVVALLSASSGDPQDRELEIGEWMWNELWTTDDLAAIDFYQELVGYEKDVLGNVEGHTYWLMQRGDRYRAGIVKLPWKDVKPAWLPYVLVENPAAVMAKAESLGGRVLLAPEGTQHGGSAVLADPSGAAIAVQSRPSRRSER